MGSEDALRPPELEPDLTFGAEPQRPAGMEDEPGLGALPDPYDDPYQDPYEDPYQDPQGGDTGMMG